MSGFLVRSMNLLTFIFDVSIHSKNDYTLSWLLILINAWRNYKFFLNYSSLIHTLIFCYLKKWFVDVPNNDGLRENNYLYLEFFMKCFHIINKKDTFHGFINCLHFIRDISTKIKLNSKHQSSANYWQLEYLSCYFFLRCVYLFH